MLEKTIISENELAAAARFEFIEAARANVPEEKVREYRSGISIGCAKYRLYSLIENNNNKPLVIKNKDGEEGYISKRSIDKILEAAGSSTKNDFTKEQHFAAAADIVNIYENSTKVLSHADKKRRPEIAAINRFVAPLYGKNVAFITAREITNGGKRIYSLELMGLGKLEGKMADTELDSASAPAASHPYS